MDIKGIGNFVAPFYPKSEKDTAQILDLLLESFLTKSLIERDRKTLAEAMQLQRFAEGEVITAFGDIGDKYFVLKSGVVKVIVYEPGSKIQDNKVKFEKELSAEPKMIGFGEIALLMNSKRTASIISQSKGGCETWVLSADVFKHIIASNTVKRRNINVAYLDKVSLFKGLEINDKLKLIDGLVTPTF